MDLFVTNYGRNMLYGNNHDGTFSDVTVKAGLDGPGLYSSAVWFDFDNNGTLDLYVGHFVKYNKALEPDCREKGVPHYCYPALTSRGLAAYIKIAATALLPILANPPGLGNTRVSRLEQLLPTSITMDYLTCLWRMTRCPNALFLNRGGGRFEEIGLEAGVAYST